ncbi:MAG: glycosyltransferase family 2 protein [Candidatus Eisenbacteria bacterium]
MSTPRLSVLTVCRNALPALRRTADSVRSQLGPGIEYRVLDGASTDGTVAYLDELATRGVVTRSEPDRGIADAMNKGAAWASGTWVAHLHADDTYLPGALDAVSPRLTDDVDVVCGWMLKSEPGGETLFRADPSRLPAEMTVNHPATFVRRAMFERHGGFDTRWPNAMDYEFFLRLWVRGARFAVLERPLARMAGGGQSEHSLRRTLAECRDIRRLHGSRWPYASDAYYLYQLMRAGGRRALQRAGLGELVRGYRRVLAWPPKG